MNEGPVLVLSTFSDRSAAQTIARTLVEERLVACANLLPEIRSIYRWQGEVCDEGEAAAVFKTTSDRFDAMRKRLVELHSYDCPEVIAIPIAAGHPPYLQWIVDSCQP